MRPPVPVSRLKPRILYRSVPWTGAPCLRRRSRGTTWVEQMGRSPFRCCLLRAPKSKNEKDPHPASERCEAEGSAVRHSCAPLLPAHNLHQSSTNPHENTNLPIVIPGFQEWSAEPQIPRLRFGMTKGEGRSKERVVAEPRHLSKPIWTALFELSPLHSPG
jgi:hypothetical protein